MLLGIKSNKYSQTIGNHNNLRWSMFGQFHNYCRVARINYHGTTLQDLSISDNPSKVEVKIEVGEKQVRLLPDIKMTRQPRHKTQEAKYKLQIAEIPSIWIVNCNIDISSRERKTQWNCLLLIKDNQWMSIFKPPLDTPSHRHMNYILIKVPKCTRASIKEDFWVIQNWLIEDTHIMVL